MEPRREALGDREVGVAVEAGGVGDEQHRVPGRGAAGQLVDGDRDAVARRARGASAGRAGRLLGRRDGVGATTRSAAGRG